jgi:hypothetical protein
LDADADGGAMVFDAGVEAAGADGPGPVDASGDATAPADGPVSKDDGAGSADSAREDLGNAPADTGAPYPPPVDSLPAQLGACPKFADGISTGLIQAPKLDELSGLVESRRSRGLLWAHNDAGNKPRLFAINKTGALAAMLDLQVAGAVDIEDIAVGPGPLAGQPYLYIADIGDNEEKRASIAIYRVVEPTLIASPIAIAGSLGGIETLPLVYPDGTHNAETLLVDPITGDLFVVTKSSSGESHVFRAPAPLSTATANQLQDTGVTLLFGTATLPGEPRATGGDVSPAGDQIVVRTYDHAYLWRRIAGQTVAQALAGMPCPLPLHEDLHGEALGFAADGSGYYTASEGDAQPIYWYASTASR